MNRLLFSLSIALLAALPFACGEGSDGDADGDSDGDSDGDGDGDADSPPRCGDGECQAGESAESCAEDCAQVGDSGFSSLTVEAGGAQRRVDFYAPESRGGSPPLLIAFHGTGDVGGDPPGEWIDEDPGNDPSGLEWLADRDGFVVAAPESRLWGEGECADWDNHDGWSGYYWETRCDSAPDRGADPQRNQDLILVRQLIGRAQALYRIDRRRVYVLGFSNGGFFSTFTAMTLGDQIAAFAEIGSGLVTCSNTTSCTYPDGGTRATDCATILAEAPASCTGCDGPERPTTIATTGRLVPGFLAHNNNDDHVSVYYTCNLARRLEELGYDVEVMIGDEQGHAFPGGAIERAWSFLSAQALP